MGSNDHLIYDNVINIDINEMKIDMNIIQIIYLMELSWNIINKCI